MDKKTKKESNIWGALKSSGRLAKKAGLICLALYAGLQVPLSVQRHSREGGSFKERYYGEFNIPIVGFESDLSGYIKSGFVNSARRRLDLELPLPNAVYVESEEIGRKGPLQFLGYVVSSGRSGFANPFTRHVTVNENSSVSTVEHEFAHIDTFELLDKHPEFEVRWKEFAKDNNGNSLYLPTHVGFCKRIRGLEHLVDDEIHRQEDNLKDGFVSSYARTNFYEDVAETIEEIAGGASRAGIEDYLGSDRPGFRDSPIRGKVSLLEEYGLIKKGYLDFKRIESIEDEIWERKDYGALINPERAARFIDETDKYIKENKGAAFIPRVHFMRANVLLEPYNSIYETSFGNLGSAPRAIQEITDGLRYVDSANDVDSRLIAFEGTFFLSRVYRNIGYVEDAERFREASEQILGLRDRNPFATSQDYHNILERYGVFD